MNTNDPMESEARLRAWLVSEAAADRPEFSQALHDRIMQSVRQAAPPTLRHTAGRRWTIRLAVAGSAAAVAVLLAVWLVRSRLDNADVAHQTPLQPPKSTPVEEETPLPVVTPEPERLASLVDATFAGSQWAYLDHDAQLATGMVLSQIPLTFSAADVP